MDSESIRIDDIVVSELKEAYRLNALPDKIDCSDDIIEPDEEFLYCLHQVIKYYLAPKDYAEWRKSIGYVK